MRSQREVVVCFHGVGSPDRELEPGEEPYWIDEGLFLGVLDLCAARADTRITFDDGNACDVEVALPRLLERGLVAAFFPLAARIDQRGSVSADGLRELARQGMTVGTHGMNHRSWRGMTPAQRDVELHDATEVIAAASGLPVTEAACPFGLYDRSALRGLREEGFKRVYTSDRAPGRVKQWLQPRYSVRHGDRLDEISSLLAADGVGLQAKATVRARLKALR
jgi:peptidoglycan/xylan/chitin deacetylase (PgdA/CDA1 family)